jgi:acyl-CoA synthetase (AMP-forming)/AMP-acid ligase II
VTLTDLLRRAAACRPTAIAVDDVDGAAVDYATLLASVDALAGWLGRRLVRGDRVALVGIGSVELIVAYHAAAAAGMVAVPLDPRLSAPEIAAILDDAEPAVVLCETELLDQAAAAVRASRTAVEVLELGTVAVGAPGAGAAVATEDDLALMLYTSGTTGRPKGVCLTHRALVWNGITIACAQRLGPDDAYLALSPLSHAGSGTRAFTMLVDAQRLVIARRFDVERFPRLLEEHRPTTTILVPTMMQQILERWPDADLAQLRSVVYGAAPSATSIIEAARERWACGLFHAYGLTEASTNVALLPPERHGPATLGSVGQELPGVRIEVRDGEDQPVADGEVGEMCIRSDKVMAGYWRQPEVTAATLRDGWLHSGDMGRRDSDGLLWLVGRSKEMLICGGNNVYPAEIENVLAAHPAVREVAVIGMPHHTMGEVPVAYAVVDEGQVASSELVAFAAGRLSGYKQPRTVHLVGSLPHTASGKVAKHELVARTQEGG